MNSIQLAVELRQLMKSGKSLYVRFNPEVLDFTDSGWQGELIICSKVYQVVVSLNSRNLISLCGLLKETIFSEGINLLCWNIKNFFTYYKYFSGFDLEVNSKLLDLKIIGAFLGHRDRKAPQIYSEASQFFRSLMAEAMWVKAQRLYLSVYMPLITKVVPAMETYGVGHLGKRKLIYPYYEIEGQVNGRLNSHKAYKNFYIPHTMDEDLRKNFVGGKSPKDVFLYFDFANMEVSTLAWLSDDKRLLEVLDLDEDFYRVIFKLATGIYCDTDKKRDFSKRAFIQTIYGQSANSLAEQNGIKLSTAEKLVDKFYELFPTAFNWLARHRVDAQDNCYDYFGRKREFKEGSYYTIRNFLIQAPSSIICLEKLISFYYKLNGHCDLVCHIHDGFVVQTDTTHLNKVALMGKEVLEDSSELCPGLQFKVNCKYGNTLEDLKDL